MQFTDSTPLQDAIGAVCPILLRPYALNGAARGYRLVEPPATQLHGVWACGRAAPELRRGLCVQLVTHLPHGGSAPGL